MSIEIKKPVGYVKPPLPELEKWVAALRSGKYKQGRSLLMKEDPVSGEPMHCCLGVLCEVWGITPKRKPNSLVFQYNGESECLPYFGNKLWDLPNGVMVKNGAGIFICSLAKLNDNGATFEDIACILEELYYQP